MRAERPYPHNCDATFCYKGPIFRTIISRKRGEGKCIAHEPVQSAIETSFGLLVIFCAEDVSTRRTRRECFRRDQDTGETCIRCSVVSTDPSVSLSEA